MPFGRRHGPNETAGVVAMLPDEKVGPPGQPTLEGPDTYATPATTTRVSHESMSRAFLGQLRNRRAAGLRLTPLPCGCRDPWPCKCDAPLSNRMVDGYRDAVAHLRAHDLLAAPLLPELRALWRRGPAERPVVAEIAERWELAG